MPRRLRSRVTFARPINVTSARPGDAIASLHEIVDAMHAALQRGIEEASPPSEVWNCNCTVGACTCVIPPGCHARTEGPYAASLRRTVAATRATIIERMDTQLPDDMTLDEKRALFPDIYL